MKTTLRSSLLESTGFASALPDDLTQLRSAGELVQCSLEAVNVFFWAGATGETTFLARTFNPRVLLTVLTYSYATGVFASSAIARACEQDETLRYLSMGVRFSADRIRLFRGHHSELLKRCLVHLIQKASLSSPLAEDTATGKAIGSLARCWAEARRRVALAVRLDQVESLPARLG